MKLTRRALSLVIAATSAASHAEERPTPKAAVDCQPQTSLNVAAIKPQVIVVGELHGNAQTPAFVSGLVCSLLKDGRSVILALERDGDEQVALNRYLLSAGDAADRRALLALPAWARSGQDGRSSEAVLALIDDMRKLRAAGQRVAVLAMQQRLSADVLQQRADRQMPMSEADNQLASRLNDRAMADTLAYAALMYRGYSVVAVAGNVHTATQRPAWISDPLYQPMGQLLSAMMPTYFLGLKSQGGTSWNCSPACGAHGLLGSKMYDAGTQIDAEVQLGKLTASPPAANGFPPARE